MQYVNPTIRAGELLKELRARRQADRDFSLHFQGEEADLVDRWAGSAVIFKNGKEGVVPITDPMRSFAASTAFMVRA